VEVVNDEAPARVFDNPPLLPPLLLLVTMLRVGDAAARARSTEAAAVVVAALAFTALALALAAAKLNVEL
jgi:hypothetical protein